MDDVIRERLEAHGYVIDGGRLCRRVSGRPGPPMAGFVAWISDERRRVDGAQVVHEVVIDGQLADGTPLPQLVLAPDELQRRGWFVKRWGLSCVVHDHYHKPVVAALLATRSGAPPRVIYVRSGWHGDQFITAAHPDADLPAALQRYRLPATPENIPAALAALLALLEVAPMGVTWPLLGAMALGPLRFALPVDFAVWLYGQTGTRKSTVAALFLSLFGDFTATSLPLAWSSTDNALEVVTNLAADLPVVIDDYASRQLQPKAERLLRQWGNSAARTRLGPGLRPLAASEPRCVPIVTGETVPTGASLVARAFIIEVAPRVVHLGRLSAAQATASLLPHAMARFIQWIAATRAQLATELGVQYAVLRDAAQGRGVHPRFPGMLASLHLAAQTLLTFAVAENAVTSSEAAALGERGHQALLQLGLREAAHQRQEQPVVQFLASLRDLLAAGGYSLHPISPAAQTAYRTTGDAPSGHVLGWDDGTHLFLLGGLAYAAVRDFHRGFPVSETQLWKELADAGLLRRRYAGRLKTSITVDGTQQWVLALDRAKVYRVWERN